MKDWYIKHPEIHHVDSTFRVNIENFQLYISMVVDAAGKGVPTGCCFMKSACKVSYNRTIKHNALKPTQHLSEAIKQLVKHAEYSYRESLR
jgi:hypothetical protein